MALVSVMRFLIQKLDFAFNGIFENTLLAILIYGNNFRFYGVGFLTVGAPKIFPFYRIMYGRLRYSSVYLRIVFTYLID